MRQVHRVILWQFVYSYLVYEKDLVSLLYDHREDGGALWAREVIHVYLCAIRKTCPVTIHTFYGVGWWVNPEDWEQLRMWLLEAPEAQIKWERTGIVGYREPKFKAMGTST